MAQHGRYKRGDATGHETSLESRGWYKDPTDRIDALYSPGCGAVGEMGGEA
jgi:hypothetical protein